MLWGTPAVPMLQQCQAPLVKPFVGRRNHTRPGATRKALSLATRNMLSSMLAPGL